MFHYEGDFWSGLPVEVRQRNKLIVININLLCLLLFGNLVFFSFNDHLLNLVFKKPYFSCVITFLSFTFYVIYIVFCNFIKIIISLVFTV